MADINIIIDKSTFQSLSFSELYRLSRYYRHNITPVLTMEIIGDLKKEFPDGKTPSEVRVKDFAKKLFPLHSVVNAHYRLLVEGDLMGDPVNSDFRPFVMMSKSVESSSGQKGMIVKETIEEKAIYKWKDGQFTEADQELSNLWRVNTTHENLLTNLKSYLSETFNVKLKDFNALNEYVETCLNEVTNQYPLLVSLMRNYDIDAGKGVQVTSRWNRSGRPRIKDFAEYAYHCLKVDLMFLYGLSSGLINTRPTNRVDLEYLYYLPFCHLFTSIDKFHTNLVPFLLKPTQRFIHGHELKQDLQEIVKHLNSLDQEEVKKYHHEPPINESSITFQLWREYFGYPEHSNLNRNISKEEFEMIKRKMDEFDEVLHEGKEVELKSSDDAEFVLKVSHMSMDDLCYCGSGKKVVDCCIPKEKFIETALIQMKKKSQRE